MASRKSRRTRRRRKRRQKRVEELQRRLEKDFPQGKFVLGPIGDVKMSDVLWAFIEPYRPYADTDEALHKLLTVALVAWNAALYPEDERQDLIEQIVQTSMPADEKTREDFRTIVNEMIERKQEYFSQYDRMILDYELTETDAGYHLSVVSFVVGSPPPDSENGS